MRRNEIRRGGRSQSRLITKSRLRNLLEQQGFPAAHDEIMDLPPRPVINALFSFIQSGDPILKWPAVRCFGAVAARLADQDLEFARVIMRRLMWNLNDESGGIGWGSPEAMGETLSRHPLLAEEYGPLFLSYARENGNYLEHEALQRGLLWGICRVAENRPDLLRGAAPFLMAYLDSGDATVRGLASRLMGVIGASEACGKLLLLAQDLSEISIDFQLELGQHSVKDLASVALRQIPCT